MARVNRPPAGARFKRLLVVAALLALVAAVAWLSLIPRSEGEVEAVPRVTRPPDDALFQRLRDIDRRLAALERVGQAADRVAVITHSVDQSIPNFPDPFKVLAFDTEVLDTDDMFDPAAPNKLTIQMPGVYLVGASLQWFATGTGRRVTVIRVNNSAQNAARDDRSAADALPMNIPVAPLRLAEGDVLRARVFHNAGSAIDVLAIPDYSPILWAMRIGD